MIGQLPNISMTNSMRNFTLRLILVQMQLMQNAVNTLPRMMMDCQSLGMDKLYFVIHHMEEKLVNGLRKLVSRIKGWW